MTQPSVRRVVVRVLALALCVAGFAGSLSCRQPVAPVHQVSGVRLSPWNGRVLGADEVRQIIVRAATLRGWLLENEQPGVVFCKMVSGSHEAVVRVDYNSAGYSISYVDSSPGLQYDGLNIHRRYNHWVDALDDAIRKEFAVVERLPTAGGEGVPVAPTVTPPPAPDAPAQVPVEESMTPSSGLAPAAPATAPASATGSSVAPAAPATSEVPAQPAAPETPEKPGTLSKHKKPVDKKPAATP
jgi:hypothetical protein